MELYQGRHDMLSGILTVFKPGATADLAVVDVLTEIDLPVGSSLLNPDTIIEDNPAPFDVTNFLPTWLVDDHENGNTLFVKFIQHYFDWLYNTDRSSIYMDNLLSLNNFENLNDLTEKSIVNSFIPGLYDIVEKYEGVPFKVFGTDENQDSYPGVGWFYPVYMRPPSGSYHEHNLATLDTDDYVKFYMSSDNSNHSMPEEPTDLELWHPNKVPFFLNPEKFVELLKNIKLDLYQRKTTKSCITGFYKTMFGEEVAVSTSSMGPGKIDISITGVPSLGVDQDYCLELYQELLEPVGIHSTFLLNTSSQSATSQEAELQEARNYSKSNKAEGFTLAAFEFPLLGNYFVYYADDTETLIPITGCEDATPPARGISANTANMPTYTHPNWTIGISGGTSFGNINIFEFVMLPYENNPNIGITSCINL